MNPLEPDTNACLSDCILWCNSVTVNMLMRAADDPSASLESSFLHRHSEILLLRGRAL
jgi:hypothetical protein